MSTSHDSSPAGESLTATAMVWGRKVLVATWFTRPVARAWSQCASEARSKSSSTSTSPGGGRQPGGHGQVEGRERARPLRAREIGEDVRPPVAAGPGVLRVPEPLHERVHRRGDAADVPPTGVRRTGEAVAGDRRTDHVERRRSGCAVRIGIAQRTDDVDELDHRPRPPVDEEQRSGIRTRRALVEGVEALAVHLHDDLVVRVEPLLHRIPVEVARPVVAELLQVGDVGAVLPAAVGEPVEPARSGQSVTQVLDDLGGDVHPGRFDVGGCARVGHD